MQLDMTKGRPMPIILRFFLPIFIGNMFQQFYNMVDSIIVGRYVGEEAFAAVGSTGTIMFLVLGFANGLSTGFTVLTSQRFGAKDEKGIRQSVSNAIILSAIVSIVMTILSVVSMGGLLRLLNTPSNIYHYAYDYIIIITGGTAAVCFYNLFSSLLRAVGNSKAPLFFLIMSAILNIFLDLLFIICFKWEVRGAAIATIASQGISAVGCLFYILVKVKILVPHRDEWRLKGSYAKKQLGVGFPMALQFGITASGTMIMQSAINRFGSTAIAGFNASSKIGNLLTQAFPALGQAMATYTGQNFGKNDIDRINRGSHVAIVISIIASLAGAGTALLLLKPAIPLFLGSNVDMDTILPWAKTYTYMSIIFYMPLGILFIYRDMMQGCGYGFLPMMGGVLELAARFTTAMLSIHFNSYLLGVAGDPAAWVVTGIFDAIAYQYVIRDVKKRFAADDKGL
ncbi:MAG: MATE family efflux transporter [bacterium LCO1.1]|uniref:MATE family efflux transporter n=1 Tax=Candidatus Weimeria bifida TaxID=2599074 RepID=A0A6N7IYI0_9FIRM|nr:MATE family efflux transporter [Candidatus Weimeria bifida]